MEILNETIYHSEDLRRLYMVVRDACTERLAWSKHESAERFKAGEQKRFDPDWPYWTQLPLPSAIRFGYYKGGTEQKAATLTARQTSVPRIGIIPVEGLNLPAMLVIAHAASDDAMMAAPGWLTWQVASKMALTLRGHIVKHKVSITDTFRLRISHKHDDLDHKRVKQARHRAKVQQMIGKIDFVTGEILTSKEQLNKQIAERSALRQQLVELREEAVNV